MDIENLKMNNIHNDSQALGCLPKKNIKIKNHKIIECSQVSDR